MAILSDSERSSQLTSVTQEIAQPVFYSHVCISKVTSLDKFCTQLHLGDRKWDSLRRIPYSTPGRWVRMLDLSELQSDATLLLDSLLKQLFPLVPFLAHLALHPTFLLSRHAMASLASHDGALKLRVMTGICYGPTFGNIEDDRLVQLLRHCSNLEQLEVIYRGSQHTDSDWESSPGNVEMVLSPEFISLHLPHLHTLSLLDMPSSHLLLSLLHSLLPSLTKLTITPYDDIPFPASLVSQFITTHGESLRSLILFTPRTWPTILHPSSPTLLQTLPNLRHLSLEMPLPRLSVPAAPHPLQVLSIPRPNSEFWKVLECLLPHLPSLKAVRARDVKWLRSGMTARAQEAGVQGELREWRRRLAPRGVRVMDSEWRLSEWGDSTKGWFAARGFIDTNVNAIYSNK